MAGSLNGRHSGRKATEPPLRLTRRGRAVLIGFIAAVLLVLFWLTAALGANAGGAGGGAPPEGASGRGETVVVEPGETLWDIARRDDPEGDPRVTVRRIADLNGLSDAIVQPGQHLRMPAR
ncbi:hypothetical protein GCM10010191_24170 [Actinomadura vinacea]|uniref:LysM domain-containing protein n=1 Tax=Actinomadura vinacea TaxID=115336 RepID=A0ABN3IVL4_9ACTN